MSLDDLQNAIYNINIELPNIKVERYFYAGENKYVVKVFVDDREVKELEGENAEEVERKLDMFLDMLYDMLYKYKATVLP